MGTIFKRILFVFVLFCSFASNAWSQTRLNVQGAGRLYPIALPQLCSRALGASAAKEIPQVIARDLKLSGYFEIINPNAYIETPGKCDDRNGFAYSDWSVIGVEGLVKGIIESVGAQIKVSLFLHDVQTQRAVLGKEYFGEPAQIRQIAHKFANEILRYFTGEEGVFGSQIVFSGRVGRFKELFIMDMDGSNVRQLTNDKGLAIAPSWNQVGTEILYTTYRDRIPEIYALNPLNRHIQRLTRTTALELGAVYAPDGRNFAVSRSIGRESSIILLDRGGNLLRKLTPGREQ